MGPDRDSRTFASLERRETCSRLLLFALGWAATPAIAEASSDAADTFQGLVGIGGGLIELILLVAVYVVSFGFFIWLACQWTGIKGTLGDAFGAAIFVAIFTAVIYVVHVLLRPYLDPYDPNYAKVVLVVGLVLAGPLAIKSTYGEGIVGSFKTFLIAAVLTGIVMAGFFFLLDVLRAQ